MQYLDYSHNDNFSFHIQKPLKLADTSRLYSPYSWGVDPQEKV